MSLKEKKGSGSFRVGQWLVEPALGQMSGDAGPITLEPKTMAVLQALAARPGEVVSGDFLVESVWGGRPMGDNPVYKCIAQLRKAFGDRASEPTYIATVPKRGYRLIAPVVPIEESALGTASTPPEDNRPNPMEEADGTSHDRIPSRLPAGTGSSTTGSRNEFSGTTGIHLVATFAIVCLGLVLAVAGISTNGGSVDEQSDSSRISLAVMPFATARDYRMPEGTEISLAREIENHLVQSDEIRITETPTGQAPGREAVVDHPDAGHTLTGRIRNQGNGTVVEARLQDRSGRTVWQENYAPTEGAQDPISRRISQDVARYLGVSPGSGISSECRGTTSVRACQSYLMAREHITGRSGDFKSRAIELLHQAISEDPAYASAHAMLARVYLIPDSEADWAENRNQARVAIERALELNDQRADALAVKGLETMSNDHGPCPPTCFDPGKYQAAEEKLRRSLEIEPENPVASLWLAIALSGQGQIGSAVSRLETAIGQDPLDPMTQSIYALYIAHRGGVEQGREHIRRFQENHPDAPEFMYRLLARIESTFGEYDRSLEYAMKASASPGNSGYDPELISVYRDLGLFTELDLLLERIPNAPMDQQFLLIMHDVRIAQGQDRQLSSLLDRVTGKAREQYGEAGQWPRWLLRSVGRSRSALGDHATAIEKLSTVYSDSGENIDFNDLVLELDGLHWLAHSLLESGQEPAAGEILVRSLEHIETMEAQGFGQFPDLILAKARAYGLKQRKALAVTHLRQAVDRGWRGYWQTHGDPRWDAMRSEADVQELFADVRRTVDTMKFRVRPVLALAGPECRSDDASDGPGISLVCGTAHPGPVISID